MGISYEPTPASKSQLAKYQMTTHTAKEVFEDPKKTDICVYPVGPIERNF